MDKDAKQQTAEAAVGLGVGAGLKATGVGYAALATSFVGNITAGYINNPENIKSSLAKDGYKPEAVQKELEGFKDYYDNEYKNGGLADVLAAGASTVGGKIFSDETARSGQFKDFIRSGGSMAEFRSISQKMGGELDLPAYVKWSIEAHEEASRLGDGRRGHEKLGEEAKADGVKDYKSARDFLREELIEGGRKMQYNDVEKSLWGRGYLLSENGQEQKTNDPAMLAALAAANNVDTSNLRMAQDSTAQGFPQGNPNIGRISPPAQSNDIVLS